MKLGDSRAVGSVMPRSLSANRRLVEKPAGGVARTLVYRFQRLFPTGHLFEDFPGGGGPGEGFGAGIVVSKVSHDGSLQLGDTLEYPPTDAFAGDLGKEALDHIEPGSRRRSEMEVEALVRFERPPRFCAWNSCRR